MDTLYPFNISIETRDLKGELSVKTIEFDRALAQNLPKQELMKIYKELKELQYQLVIKQTEDRKLPHSESIE